MRKYTVVLHSSLHRFKKSHSEGKLLLQRIYGIWDFSAFFGIFFGFFPGKFTDSFRVIYSPSPKCKEQTNWNAFADDTVVSRNTMHWACAHELPLTPNAILCALSFSVFDTIAHTTHGTLSFSSSSADSLTCFGYFGYFRWFCRF